MNTPIPEAEIDVFKQLPDLKVIFDVGARTDCEYISLCPEAEFHLFEVNPQFIDELIVRVFVDLRDKDVTINNFGLGDTDGVFSYSDGLQALDKGEAFKGETEKKYPVKTLDWYTKDNQIKQIDFLKIDTEGYDFKVLKGGKKSLKFTKFLQYEHWNDKVQFHDLLNRNFDLVYIGYRNVLGMNKKLVSKATREQIKNYIESKGYKDLS